MSGIDLTKNVENFLFGFMALYFGTFIGVVGWNMFPPQFTRLVRTNLLFRQLSLFVFILISIEFLSPDPSSGGSSVNQKMTAAAFLYLTILLFPKQTLYFSLIEMALFYVIFFVFYYENKDIEDGNDELMKILVGVFLGFILIGATQYYYKQRMDRPEDFSHTKFFFGSPEGMYI